MKPAGTIDMPDGWKTEEEEASRRDVCRVGAPVEILVVDDEPCILHFLAAVFRLPDYEVRMASNDKLALELAGTQVFDVAFLDYFLEETTGAEVARRLREMQPNLKIILMSGYIVNDRDAKMEQVGADAFLSKPFSDNTARLIVAHLLPRVKQRQSLPADTANYF